MKTILTTCAIVLAVLVFLRIAGTIAYLLHHAILIGLLCLVVWFFLRRNHEE